MEDCEKIKALFIALIDIENESGVANKVLSQNEALCDCGLDSKLCYLKQNNNGYIDVYIDNDIIQKDIKSQKLIYYTNIIYKKIYAYILKNNIHIIYYRRVCMSHFFILHFFKKLRKQNCKILFEIPTYPYAGEIRGTFCYIKLLIDKMYRNKLYKYIYRIITFSDDDEIYNIRTLKIDNAVNFNKIPLKKEFIHNDNTIYMIGVAQLSYWHGYDRIIEGLKEYYKTNYKYKVIFNIVGYGSELPKLQNLVKEYKLSEFVFFNGKKSGKDLNILFDKNDIAIGCLGCHRKNMEAVKSLKNAEYAARGIPFIYSENNDNFDNMPYVLKVTADEMPIDINSIIKFYNSTNWNPIDIRNSIIGTLSWKKQMGKVVECIDLK